MKRTLHVVSIILLTAICLGFFFWNIDFRAVGHQIANANPIWMTIGLTVNLLALVFRSLRWRTLLDPDDPPRFYPTFFANAIGYMLSTVLPIRAGDVARPALLSRRTKVKFSAALGTVLTERILDLFMIVSLFLWYAVAEWRRVVETPRTHALAFVVEAGALGSAAILVALLVLLFGIFFFRDRVRRLHFWLGSHLPHRFRDPWMKFYDSFVTTLDLARRPAMLLRVVFYTVCVWACLTSQFWFVVRAAGAPLPFDSAFLVNGTTTLGLAIPTPGGVGGFHAICRWVLTGFYGFDVNLAATVALLFHAVGTIPVIVTGVVLILKDGLTWHQITEIEQEAEQEGSQVSGPGSRS